MGSMREAEKFSFGMVGLVLDMISKGISSPVAIVKAISETVGQPATEASVQRSLTYAHRRGYLKQFGQTGAFHYQLEPAGEQRLAQLQFRAITFNPENWDGQWRVLFFDIPERNRSQRDMVRHLVRQLGMRPLQKSVWLTPADCREQFEQLRQAFGINQTDLLLLEVRASPSLESYKTYWW